MFPLSCMTRLSAGHQVLGWKYIQAAHMAAFLETKRAGQREQAPASDGCGTRHTHFEAAILISSCGTEPPRAPACHCQPCCTASLPTPLPERGLARPEGAGRVLRSALPEAGDALPPAGCGPPHSARSAGTERPQACGKGRPRWGKWEDGRTTRGEAGSWARGGIEVQMTAETTNWLWAFWSFPDTARRPHSSGHTKFA